MARKALGPATWQIVQAVRAGTPDRPLLAAVSGGADSLALAHAVLTVCTERGQRCAAVTVDHGLQDGSADVAARTGRQLTELGYDDVVTRSVQAGAQAGPGSVPAGPEGRARTARYAVLDAEAARRGAGLVLGHTLDDQAETVLLGLGRGSGTRSLAGMASTADRLRPLLGIRRERTRTACVEIGLEPWQDPHNREPRFARARVRHRVLPVLEAELGPGVAESLARTAQLAADDAALLDRMADDLLVAVRRGADLDCSGLEAADPALRGRVLKRWLTESGATETPYAQVRAVEALITAWHGQSEIQIPGLSVRRTRGLLTTT